MSPKPWREALEELSRRKLRTGLTLLGLIFGVGAIVAMLGVGEGSRQEALALVEGLGLRNLIVESRPAEGDALREARARSPGLTLADAEAALAVVPGAEAIAAEKRIRIHQAYSDLAAADIEASAVSGAYFELASLVVERGRGLSADDEAAIAQVAVLGPKAAASLFPNSEPLGQWIKLNHAWFEVVGILADRDLAQSDFEGVPLGLEAQRVYVPLASAQARLRFQPLEDPIDRFLLRVADPEQIGPGSQVLAALMDQRHGGVADYALVVPAQLYRQHQQTQRIFRIVMGAIAAVSLLVGGIGIMNIMLANVLERRREIGLMRAIGARRRHIVEQFLREAALICGIGALAGLLFGMGLAYVIAVLAGWPVAWAPIPVLLSAGLCALIGLAFGVYPARQAARLDPIAALRTD
jgi:putative ABC transport system permease protein